MNKKLNVLLLMLALTACSEPNKVEVVDSITPTPQENMIQQSPQPTISTLSQKDQFLYWAGESGYADIWTQYSKAVAIVTEAVQLDQQGKESFATMTKAVTEMQLLKYRLDSVANYPSDDLKIETAKLSAQIQLLSEFKDEISRGDLSRRQQIVSTLQNMTDITNNINQIIQRLQS